jgi:hypothetical protein
MLAFSSSLKVSDAKRELVVGLTGVPLQETGAYASGNGRNAQGPCAAGLHNFTSCPTSRLLPLLHIPHADPHSPSLLAPTPTCVCLEPSASRQHAAGLFEHLKLESSRSAVGPVYALVADLTWAGSLRDSPSNTYLLLAASPG